MASGQDPPSYSNNPAAYYTYPTSTTSTTTRGNNNNSALETRRPPRSRMPPLVTFRQGQPQDKPPPPPSLAVHHRGSTLMVTSKVGPLTRGEYGDDRDPKGTSSLLSHRTHPVHKTKKGSPGPEWHSHVMVEVEEAKSSNEFLDSGMSARLPPPPPPPPPPILSRAPAITTTATTAATAHKRLVRQQSEPVGGGRSGPSSCRRAIFDRYWKHEDMVEEEEEASCRGPNALHDSSSPPPPPPTIRPRPQPRRIRSTSAPANVASSAFWDWGLGGYGPPTHSTFIRHRDHFLTTRRLLDATTMAPAAAAFSPEADPAAGHDDSSSTSAAATGSSSHWKPHQHPPPALPPLPVPLQRFHTDGRGSSMAGMYPLVRAQSILRQSSYRVATSRIRADSDGGMLPEYETFSFPGMGDTLNLTRSVSRLVTLKSQDMSALSEAEGTEEDQATDATASSTSISSAATHSAGGNGAFRRGVSFDPRITVTEFEDANPRLWFTDAELERFRMETVLVAQKYLLKHPELIDLYNKPMLDPVTGTLRKRALFSMPALRAGDASSVSSGSTGKCSFDDDDDDDPTAAEPLHRHRKNMKELAFRNVKSILVADRNKIILDLFRRSLRPLFPHARITTVQSGEEAWRHFAAASESQHRHHGASYDIVIAEERLDQPLTVTGTPLVMGGKKSLSSSSAERGSDATAATSALSGNNVLFKFAGPHHVRHDSLLALPSQRQAKKPLNGCSGSDLLRKISATYDSDTDGGPPPSRNHPATAESHHPHASSPPCLLIGVSVQPDHERERFVAAGADAVWGKPPPRMDEGLRDELVSLLLRKRGRHPGT